MPRISRVVVPWYPHHVTQRGNRRQQTFFCDEDYLAYLELMAEWCRRCGVEIWAYCLMPNHVHLIAVPKSEDVSVEKLTRAKQVIEQLVAADARTIELTRKMILETGLE